MISYEGRVSAESVWGLIGSAFTSLRERKKDSKGARIRTPRPERPARAVRPRRWMYCSPEDGRPVCMTSVILAKIDQIKIVGWEM